MLMILSWILLSDLHIIKFTSSECTILWQFLGEVVAVVCFGDKITVFRLTSDSQRPFHFSFLCAKIMDIHHYPLLLMRVDECIQPCTQRQGHSTILPIVFLLMILRLCLTWQPLMTLPTECLKCDFWIKKLNN